jgi:two-component system OmpR family sensor kinase
LLFRRSLRVNFLLKLIVALATLIFFTSFSFYFYIRINSTYELKDIMQEQAKYLFKKYDDLENALNNSNDTLQSSLGINAKIEYAPYVHYQPKFFRNLKKGDHFYFQGFFPYEFKTQKYLVLTKDITRRIKVENMIYKSIIIVNLLSLVVIIIYAFFLSKMLLKPIQIVSKKIAKMSEKELNKIDTNKLPNEFKPLGNSINQLINKVEHFLKYKKELFIGAAHELKTPLAVMKTKSQVALLKRDKSIETLQEALKQNIKSIDSLNSTIESILAFGREEGAQFEKSKNIDIIEYISNMLDEFEIVAIKEEKYIVRDLKPKSLKINIQISLFRQILQNLLQNALRFSKKGNKVKISSFICEKSLVIRVKDSGSGLPDDFDIYAPFQRSRNSCGTGLGLFLAKNAANSLNAKLSLKNKLKKNGVVATIILPIKQ